MPPTDVILESTARIANNWRVLAIAWHLYFGVLMLLLARYRLSNRSVGYLLVLPELSVSVLAWAAGNPFNGLVFAALALGLAAIASHLPDTKAHVGSRAAVAVGLSLAAFGWVYPHFLDTRHWTTYLVAAPLGLVPCPTLAAVIGLTIAFGRLRSNAWSVTLGAAGFAYGVVGMFSLGVTLDLVLTAGAAMLLLGLGRHPDATFDCVHRSSNGWTAVSHDDPDRQAGHARGIFPACRELLRWTAPATPIGDEKHSIRR